MRRRVITRDGTNHHEKLGLPRILCVSECNILDTAGTSPNQLGNNTPMGSFQPEQASCTPDFPYLLVSFTLFSFSSPLLLFLVHNSTIIAGQKVKLSLSICACHGHELTWCTAYTVYIIHWVQHTLSTAYTEYRIHPGFFLFPSYSWVQVDPGL